MSLLRTLRPTLPILIGASVMLTFSMGLRQSLGIFLQPLTRDIGISVSQFTLAIAVPPAGAAISTRAGRSVAIGFPSLTREIPSNKNRPAAARSCKLG